MTRVTYTPPPGEVIDRFAQNVCDALADRVDESFRTPEVVWGFANFIRVVAAIQARHLSKGFDNDDDEG